MLPPDSARLDNAFPARWLVWLVALLFVFAGLGSPGISDNNEGLYAEISREMLVSHDWRHWVIPHLNGLPYLEKPPLLYWLTALSFSLFGLAEWSARLVPAISALSCVAMMLRLGNAIQRPRAGRLGAFMFITGLGVSIMSRLLMFDMLLAACLTGALFSGYRYLTEGNPAQLRWSMLWLGLGILSKGLVALLLYLLVVGVFLLSIAGLGSALFRAAAGMLRPDALALLLAIVLPWHIAASLAEPLFPWLYFVNEHVLRFLGKREPHDYYNGPFWYYLPRVMLYLFPWPLFVLGLLGRQQPLLAAGTATLRRFLFVAWLLPLLFFSLSQAKANYYLVVVMPFAALHLAIALENRGLQRPAVISWPGYAIAVLGAALCLAGWLRPALTDKPLQISDVSLHTLLLAVFAAIGLLGFLCSLLARRLTAGMGAYLMLPMVLGAFTYSVVMAMQPLETAKPLAQWLQREASGHEVYLYRNFEDISSLPFYLEQPLHIVDSRSRDLLWGNRLKPSSLMCSDNEFNAIVQSRKKIAIIVMDRHLQAFRARPYAARLQERKHIGRLTVFMD